MEVAKFKLLRLPTKVLYKPLSEKEINYSIPAIDAIPFAISKLESDASSYWKSTLTQELYLTLRFVSYPSV